MLKGIEKTINPSRSENSVNAGESASERADSPEHLPKTDQSKRKHPTENSETSQCQTPSSMDLESPTSKFFYPNPIPLPSKDERKKKFDYALKEARRLGNLDGKNGNSKAHRYEILREAEIGILAPITGEGKPEKKFRSAIEHSRIQIEQLVQELAPSLNSREAADYLILTHSREGNSQKTFRKMADTLKDLVNKNQPEGFLIPPISSNIFVASHPSMGHSPALQIMTKISGTIQVNLLNISTKKRMLEFLPNPHL